MRAAKLAFWSAIAYTVFLVLIRGVLPQGSPLTISLLGIPLIVVAVIITRDLTRRSTNPTVVRTGPPAAFREDPVGLLKGQIRVAAGTASNSYFENMVRGRLKDLLIDKVSVETGFEKEFIRQLLSDPARAQRLLRNPALYDVLMGPVPRSGPDRMKMINSAIDMIGEWKG